MGCCGGGGNSKLDEVDSSRGRNPLASRKNVCCTDVVFLILFISFWGLLVYIAIFSIINGDAKRLLYGYDTFGNTCNQQYNSPIKNLSLSGLDTSGKDNVFFMSATDPLHSMQICISSCPNETLRTVDDVKRFTNRTNISLCKYGFNDYKEENFKKSGPCPALPVYNSFSLLFRCVPRPDKEQFNKSIDIINKFREVFELDDLFRKVLSDVYICWREIIALCIIALVIAFLVVLVMRFLASIVVWLIVILAIVGSLVGTGFLWWTWFRLPSEGDKVETYNIPVIGVDVTNKTTFLVFSIIASVLTVILLLILLVMRKRIALVVALFHEAGKCLIDIPMLLIQPLWTFLVLFVFLCYWVFVLAYVATLGTPKAASNISLGFDRVEYIRETFPKQFWWIHVIGLIWTSEFILACQQFVIAGAVANWFFRVNKKRLGCPLVGSVNNLVLHHLGSIAFGSLIITLVKIPRYILMYIQKKFGASQNACAQCCLKCCICCLWCLEKLLKFLNQNAYTIIAIDGTNFCSAAQRAFSILTSNILRVAAINSVGVFVLFLGKIGVTAATCAIAIVWLKSLQTLHYFAIPVFFVSVFSFLIAHCFLSVYEMVVDALLMCFCEDDSLNDGSPGKEFFMSTSLKEFVQVSSERMEKMERGRVPQSETSPSEKTELSPSHNK